MAATHGQLTLMIILGIVIAGVFALFFIALAMFSGQQLEQERTRVVEKELELTPIKRYVSVCAQDALETGLDILAKQGGYLFQGQPGGISDPDYLLTTRKIAYGIVPTKSEPPTYPCPEKYHQDAPFFCKYPYQAEQVRFGQDKLPDLSGGVFSIQRQLERYIGAYVNDCVDLFQVSQLQGFEAVLAKDATATVRFESDAVVANITYPFVLGEEDDTTTVVDFNAEIPVRFKELYDAIKDLVVKDTEFIDLNIQEPQQSINDQYVKLTLLSPAIVIERTPSGKDDIIAFTDSASRLRERPFTFQFARKNRPPVLEYIGDPTITDYNLRTADTPLIQPIARDPDEDDIAYSYRGELGESEGDEFIIPSVRSGIYIEQVIASDGYETDWQDVQVLVD